MIQGKGIKTYKPSLKYNLN